jgi:hypothetical protein
MRPSWPSTAPVGFDETHSYANPGAYTATVTTTDQSGQTNTQTITEDVYASTTTTIAANPNPSDFGEQVTLTATITPSSPVPSTFTGTPTGTVSFYDLTGGAKALLGTATPGADGNPPDVATFNLSSLSVASHPLEAVFAGDNDFGGSDSSNTSYNLVVSKDSTMTGLGASPNPVVHGRTVTLTATVSVSAPGIGTPTGSVTFKDGTTTLGTEPLTTTTTGGVTVTSASLSTGALGVGLHSLTASYSGDTDDTGSNGLLALNVDTDLSGFPKSGGAFNLRQASLAGADLDGENLAGANLSGINLKGAILAGANLTGAVLKQANLAGANLTGANLAGANLTGADLKGAVTTGVDWSDTTCPDGTSSNADGGTCVGHF